MHEQTEDTVAEVEVSNPIKLQKASFLKAFNDPYRSDPPLQHLKYHLLVEIKYNTFLTRLHQMQSYIQVKKE
jgi:hypothetical protein